MHQLVPVPQLVIVVVLIMRCQLSILDMTSPDPTTIKQSFNVSLEERSKIEEETRSQSRSFQWFAVRA